MPRRPRFSDAFVPSTAVRLSVAFDSFDALASVPEDKTVVLGLVTTKTGRVETVDELSARIEEASRFVPIERLAAARLAAAERPLTPAQRRRLLG